MAENATIARPYAEAAFSLAKDKNALDGWSTALNRLATSVTLPQVKACLGNPRISTGQMQDLFGDVLGTSAPADARNFVRVLIDNDRLAVLPEISEQFEVLKNNAQGVKEANITSAFPLDDASLRQLTADVEQRYGCKILPVVTVDASLIGGVKIAVGDEVIDASVRGKLASMAASLMN